MPLIETLFNAKIITAAAVYGLLSLVEVWVSQSVEDSLQHDALDWAWTRILGPLLRVVLIIVFILLAYPALYALENAPSLAQLFEDDIRFSHLLNGLFLLSLLLPLLPVIGQRAELVLPLQGIFACAMVFNWIAQTRGYPPVDYWPGSLTVFAIAGIALSTHWLAAAAAEHFGRHINLAFDVTGGEKAAFQAAVLLFQIPAIVLYGLSLGQQL